MKTKIIPFDLETAKKIQAGEIKGEIKTTDKQNVRIVCWDRIDTETPIVFLVQYGSWEGLFEGTSTGEYTIGHGDNATLSKLVLEVPDNDPQFKPFDKVLVRDVEQQKWACSIFSYLDKDQDGIVYYNANGLNWNQCIPYEGNQDLVGTTNKPKED